LGDIVVKAKSVGTLKLRVKEYYNGDIPFLSISDMAN